LLGIFFDSNYVGDVILQTVLWLSADYTALSEKIDLFTNHHSVIYILIFIGYV
jgi:hypothetical protein